MGTTTAKKNKSRANKTGTPSKNAVKKTIAKKDGGSAVVKKRVRNRGSDSASLQLDRETVKTACFAMLKAHKVATAPTKGEDGKASMSLIDDLERVSLQFQLSIPPKTPKLMPKRVELAHGLYTADHSICLIVRDPVDSVTRVLDRVGYGGVTKVIGVKELKLSYKTHERRRALAAEHDLFLVDTRVAASMPHHLGSWFVKANKLPLPVNLDRALPDVLERAVCSSGVIVPAGVTATVHIGTTNMKAKQLEQNIMKVAARAAEILNNEIEAVYLRSHHTSSLPLFVRMPTRIAEDPVEKKVDEIDAILEKYEEEELE